MKESGFSEKVYKALHERNAIQRFVARKLFGFFQRLGFHVTGDHFYELTPNTRVIARAYRDEPRPCRGIDIDLSWAETYLTRLIGAWGDRFFASAGRFGYVEANTYFTGLDALALYCMVREMLPASVVEVGQGFSTRVLMAALEDNHFESGTECEFISIDPYPRVAEGPPVTGVSIRLLREEVQALAGDREELLSSDLVFVDSSHVHKFGSDVAFLFDEIYPRIAPGTVVHLHDIFTPYEYPQDWYVRARRFWNEQFHLENFLRFNAEFEVILPVHLLTRQSAQARRVALEACAHPGFKPTGQSFYMRRRTPGDSGREDKEREAT